MPKKKSPFTTAELRKRIRSGDLRIEIAPQNSVEALRPYIDRVVKAIEDLFEIEGLLVTDESCVGDCVPHESNDRSKDLDVAYKKLGHQLGIKLDRANDDTHSIVQIAYKLKKRHRGTA